MATYKIEVWTTKEHTQDYGGGYTAEEVRLITKGWKPDKEFSFGSTVAYTRKNSTKMFFVEEE